MKRLILIFSMLLLATAGTLAEQGIEEKLMVSARRVLPQVLSTNEIARAFGGGLWNSNRTAVAIAIAKKPKGTRLFVFLRQVRGDYLAINVSGIEAGNIGRIGPMAKLRACRDNTG